MDDFQNDNQDLLNFINKKCQDKLDISPKHIFFLFTKGLRCAIINTYVQQQNFQYTISCSELIVNIFFIIFNYSLNAKLTIFMCDRATLLFNEYINISKNYNNEQLNLLDVKQFIINKTVGPLRISPKKSNKEISNISNLGQLYARFIYRVFSKIHKKVEDIDYNYTDFLESISSILSNVLYDIHTLGLTTYIENELTILVSYDILDLPREVNLLKIKLELYISIHDKNDKTPETNINLVNETMRKNIDIIDESCDINDFLNCNERIQDMEFFKKLIQKII